MQKREFRLAAILLRVFYVLYRKAQNVSPRRHIVTCILRSFSQNTECFPAPLYCYVYFTFCLAKHSTFLHAAILLRVFYVLSRKKTEPFASPPYCYVYFTFSIAKDRTFRRAAILLRVFYVLSRKTRLGPTHISEHRKFPRTFHRQLSDRQRMLHCVLWMLNFSSAYLNYFIDY